MSPTELELAVQMRVVTFLDVALEGDQDQTLAPFSPLSDNLTSEAPLRIHGRAFEGQLFPARICLDSVFRSGSLVAISVCVTVQFEMLSPLPTEFSGLESSSS